MDVAVALGGGMPVLHVFRLIERLLDEPWSRYRAHLLGGDEHWRDHLGWGPSEYLQAALIDAVQMNTVVTAYHGSGKRAKPPEQFPRPTAVRESRPRSLDDINVDFLDAEVNRGG